MSLQAFSADLTSFVGREAELHSVGGLVDGSRLVTLTGAAGSGKTRLALELARQRADERPVWWVELAPLRDPALIAPAISEAAGVHQEVRPQDLPGLVRLLADRRALLVLDNCEHLVDACAEVVGGLLVGCPQLAILATSREALGVPGERAWLVPPLEVPDEDGRQDPAGTGAVRLFVDRARDVVPGFELTDPNKEAVASICRRLDGIPLAIELAAARMHVLPPQAILERLDDVFRVLTDGRRTLVPRHRTLRAAIDWSHDLLEDRAAVLFRRLAVFRGGFTLEAAERVGPGRPILESDVLDLVARLVDRSMLVVREHDGFARYHMLEAVRQYATERLVESGEEGEVRERHARYVLDLVEEAEPHFIRAERKQWVERLLPEIDNLRSALHWTREHATALHLPLVGRLWWFWFSTQHWAEGGRWITGALELPEAEVPGLDRARLLFAAGALCALQVRAEPARRALEEAADLASRHGADHLAMYATNYLGMTYAGEGAQQALELCGRAESWFREHSDLYGLRLAALLQGSAAMVQGRLEEAERKNREGVEVARAFGLDRELAIALQNLSTVLILQGRLEEAGALIREALDRLRRDPSWYFTAHGLGYLGEIAGRGGHPLEAARLLGAAEGARARVGAAPFPHDLKRIEALLPVLRQAAGATAFDRAWADGRATDPDRVVDGLLAERPATGSDPGTTADPRAVPVAPEPPAPDTDVASGMADPAREAAGPGPDEPQQSPRLRVDALGPLLVHVDGEPVSPERWPYGKPRELLVFLLLHESGATRDRIGEALWPGAARSNVKNSFHVTLHHLRKALGHPGWIVLEGDRYRLAPELSRSFDLDRFRAQAGAARQGADPDTLRRVLGLYRGELLEGESAGRWIDEHRDAARRLHLEVRLLLARQLEAADPEAAVSLYREIAADEPLEEEVHRRLMALWAERGERVRALRHFDRVELLLRETLDAEPEPATVALRDRIRLGSEELSPSA